jgi:eukaryotic-like serine/threonine-protein kinase
MTHSYTPGGHLTPGTVLEGRYEITGFIGAGGFALVYRARETAIQRDVAIKILSAPRDGEDLVAFRERFSREAQTAARIHHPNVVTVHGFGMLETQPYIVMELLEGADLNDLLRDEGPMPPTRAIPLFVNVLDALGEAHRQGIIHKDLKPANLFLHHAGTRREMMKVVDFGIARIGHKGGHLTTTGQLMGTPRYYAPEYIKNQVVTPSLDVYQMGLILVETFTGKPVVNVDDPYVCLMRHSNGELGIPMPLLDSPLGPVLVKALELDHQSRFLDCHAFREALEEIDPASVPILTEGAPCRLISEISGAMDSFAFHPSTSTGSMANPTSESGKLRHPDAVVIDSEGFARSATGPRTAPVSASDSGRTVGRSAKLRKMTSGPSAAPAVVATPKSRLPIILGLAGLATVLLLALSLGGTGAFLIMDDEPQAPTQPVEPAEPEGFSMEAAPVPVEIQLVSEPAGARVCLGDEVIGRTPYRHKFAHLEAAAVDVRLELAGYDDAKLSFGPTGAATRTVRLVKTVVAPETKVVEPPPKVIPKRPRETRPKPKPKPPAGGSGKMKLPPIK